MKCSNENLCHDETHQNSEMSGRKSSRTPPKRNGAKKIIEVKVRRKKLVKGPSKRNDGTKIIELKRVKRKKTVGASSKPTTVDSVAGNEKTDLAITGSECSESKESHAVHKGVAIQCEGCVEGTKQPLLRHSTSEDGSQDEDASVIRVKDTPKYLGVSRSTYYNFRNLESEYFQKDFPEIIHLGDNSKCHFKADLDAWLRSKKREIVVDVQGEV